MTFQTTAPAAEILKIERRYRELKARPVADLRSIVGRSHRVSDLRNASKSVLVSTVLSDEFRARVYNKWCQMSAREVRALARRDATLACFAYGRRA